MKHDGQSCRRKAGGHADRDSVPFIHFGIFHCHAVVSCRIDESVVRSAYEVPFDTGRVLACLQDLGVSCVDAGRKQQEYWQDSDIRSEDFHLSGAVFSSVSFSEIDTEYRPDEMPSRHECEVFRIAVRRTSVVGIGDTECCRKL